MSNKIQTSKNIELTGKLFDYLLKSGNFSGLPDNASVVPFSKTDKKLNRENERLVENLKEVGNPIVIAEEPKSKSDSWSLTPVNF